MIIATEVLPFPYCPASAPLNRPGPWIARTNHYHHDFIPRMRCKQASPLASSMNLQRLSSRYPGKCFTISRVSELRLAMTRSYTLRSILYFRSSHHRVVAPCQLTTLTNRFAPRCRDLQRGLPYACSLNGRFQRKHIEHRHPRSEVLACKSSIRI